MHTPWEACALGLQVVLQRLGDLLQRLAALGQGLKPAYFGERARCMRLAGSWGKVREVKTLGAPRESTGHTSTRLQLAAEQSETLTRRRACGECIWPVVRAPHDVLERLVNLGSFVLCM